MNGFEFATLLVPEGTRKQQKKSLLFSQKIKKFKLESEIFNIGHAQDR